MRPRRFFALALLASLALVSGCAPTVMRPSAGSLSYAKELGGTSHDGERLCLVVGATAESEADAQGLLDDALPLFGDMQSYFIVQASDSFEGLDAGEWVVVEAYREAPSQENLDFARRAFPEAYARQVTVRTTDPIPVYEDLVGQ